MVVNAKIGVYVGIDDAWNRTAQSGVGIKAAADYAMSTTATDEEDAVTELLQPLAAVASVYGDPDGKYAAFFSRGDQKYPSRGYYLLASGLSDSGLTPTPSASAEPPQATGVDTNDSGVDKHNSTAPDTASQAVGQASSVRGSLLVVALGAASVCMVI